MIYLVDLFSWPLHTTIRVLRKTVNRAHNVVRVITPTSNPFGLI